MTSRMKWLIIGPLLTLASLAFFSATFGTGWAFLPAPLIGIGAGLWGYGWIKKVGILEKVSSWMNSDT